MAKEVKRKIYFYHVTESNCTFRDVITKINQLNGNDLFASIFIDKSLFLEEAIFEDEVIKGTITSAKGTDFPSKVKIGERTPAPLELEDDECLSESTHFVYFEKFNILAIEYNYSGPKASHIERYIQDRILNKLGGNDSIFIRLLLNKEFYEKFKEVENIKKLEIRVSKDRVADLDGIDGDLKEVLKRAKNIGEVEDIEIILRARSRSRKNILNSTSDFVKNMKALFRTEQPSDIFDKFKMDTAETEDGQIEPFDLLKDKIESEVRAIKIGRGNMIDSDDMYAKMITSFNNRKRFLVRSLPSEYYEIVKEYL